MLYETNWFQKYNKKTQHRSGQLRFESILQEGAYLEPEDWWYVIQFEYDGQNSEFSFMHVPTGTTTIYRFENDPDTTAFISGIIDNRKEFGRICVFLVDYLYEDKGITNERLLIIATKFGYKRWG